MSRYHMSEHVREGTAVIVLTDHESRVRAEVVPRIGAQIHSLRWTVGDKEYDILASAPDLATLGEQPMYFGNPLLFPFPNRVAGGRFTFGGKTYQLPITETERGHSLHGLVYDKAWKAAAAGADDKGAWVQCTFSTDDCPDILEAYPFPFHLDYTVRLREGRLETRFTVTNRGTEEMPMGFGMHPWFPLPLAPDGSREQCRVQAPVSKVWELDDLLPTGRMSDPPPERDIQTERILGDLFFDDVYTGVTEEGWWEATYFDPAAQIEVAVASDGAMREFVLYTAPDRPVICLEPYSCTTNAANLQAQGIDAGLVVLSPGSQWSTEVHFILRRRS